MKSSRSHAAQPSCRQRGADDAACTVGLDPVVPVTLSRGERQLVERPAPRILLARDEEGGDRSEVGVCKMQGAFLGPESHSHSQPQVEEKTSPFPPNQREWRNGEFEKKGGDMDEEREEGDESGGVICLIFTSITFP